MKVYISLHILSATAATQKMDVCYTSATASATAATNYAQLRAGTSVAVAPEGVDFVVTSMGSLVNCWHFLGPLLVAWQTAGNALVNCIWLICELLATPQ